MLLMQAQQEEKYTKINNKHNNDALVSNQTLYATASDRLCNSHGQGVMADAIIK
jgi:hypothetical protein